MKISLKWLNDYVNVSDYFSKPEVLAKMLVDAGLEVESITDEGKQFQHVVVGHILEKGQHPDADKLTLCQLDVGDGKPRQIVCGARNHQQGDKVVVTLPGAVLPGNFEIKLSKIRGVESQGMLASEVELGIAKESNGIMILPKDAPVGKSFSSYMGFDDILFEIGVTPNRADCMSHLGLAREVATLLGRPFEVPVASFEATGESTEKLIKVSIEDSVSCPRYAARAVRGVKVGPSPKWLVRKLESIGMNSINNIVDITNFVMMELGQPLHAFDASQLQGQKIIVRKATKGEKFKTLDGTELTLTGEELTIRDEARPVALAGVVGGQNSGVSDSTRDILIESAFFASDVVRRSARQHGVDTDSGQRFSRGTDPEGVLLALNRAADLMQKEAGGVIAQDFIDIYPKPMKRDLISLHVSYVSERLGYTAEKEKLVNWLVRLGCQVTSLQTDLIEVAPPAYRWDLYTAADLVEEYGRLEGYDKIPEKFPALEGEPAKLDPGYIFESKVQNLMAAEGFHQAINYNFLNRKTQLSFLGDVSKLKPLGLETTNEPVMIKNPLSEELNSMRVSLLPGLFNNALNNFRYGTERGQLFETGGVYAKKSGETGEQFVQSTRLGAVLWGKAQSLWQKQDVPAVLRLKKHIENFLEALLIQGYQWRSLKAEEAPDFMHPGQWAGLFCEGRMIGVIGTLHPLISEDNKLRTELALAEFDIAALGRGQPRLPKVKSIAKHPRVERDLAFILPEDFQAANVISDMQKAGAPFVQNVQIVDVYKGTPLKENQRSVTYKFWLQKTDGSFSDDEMKSIQEKIIQAVTKKHPVEVR